MCWHMEKKEQTQSTIFITLQEFTEIWETYQLKN